MRKANYSLKQVVCKNSSFIGHSSNVAKPGYWIRYKSGAQYCIGRVMGRIEETDSDGPKCVGHLAVMSLFMECTHAGVRWIHPDDVTHCYEKPPAELLAWITGDEWVKNKTDIARLVAMSEHGTTSDQFIASRKDSDKAYNARPEYVSQFILG